MNKSSKKLNNGVFNTIYVEEKALEYPIARQLLERYADCPVITIGHYKDVFNRPRQHFALQKQKQSLILAVKERQFLYKGPEVCQNFGHPNFYYTSFLLNCIFDCEYCYLQGMYPSANIVAFVNVEDFQKAMGEILLEKQAFLAVSYDTDLIAFHNIVPYMDYFYGFFRENQDLLVEIRTKSANQSFYRDHEPLENIMPKKGQGRQFLEILSRIEGTSSGESFVGLCQRMKAKLPWGTTVVMIVPRDTDELMRFAQSLIESGFKVVIITVQSAKFREYLGRSTTSSLILYQIREEDEMSVLERKREA